MYLFPGQLLCVGLVLKTCRRFFVLNQFTPADETHLDLAVFSASPVRPGVLEVNAVDPVHHIDPGRLDAERDDVARFPEKVGRKIGRREPEFG